MESSIKRIVETLVSFTSNFEILNMMGVLLLRQIPSVELVSPPLKKIIDGLQKIEEGVKLIKEGNAELG